MTLGLTEDPLSYTPALLVQTLRGKKISYADLRWVNDFRILLCGWLDSLHFDAARRLLAERGYLKPILAGLPLDDDCNRLRALLEQKLAAHVCRYNSKSPGRSFANKSAE